MGNSAVTSKPLTQQSSGEVGDNLNKSHRHCSRRSSSAHESQRNRPNSSNHLSVDNSSQYSPALVVNPAEVKECKLAKQGETEGETTVEAVPKIPVITVTDISDQQEKPLTTPLLPVSSSDSNHDSQRKTQPGLTGVPRHKPITPLSKTSSTRSMSSCIKRSTSVSSSPVRRRDSKGSTVQKSKPNTGALILNRRNSPPIKSRPSDAVQPRVIKKEYERLGTPPVVRRSSSRRYSPSNPPRRCSQRRLGRGPPQSRLEYTFYIRDTDEQRKPFDENTADAIARGCQCSIELITLGKGFPPIVYKGVKVCPVTVTTSNMKNLRKCLARLDAHYPEFHAKAFLPRNT